MLRAFFSRLSPLTALVLAAAAAQIGLNLALAYGFHQPTLFDGTSAFFHRYIYGLDSWMPMREAYWYLRKHGPADPDVYQGVFFLQQTKFQYPLTSLLVYEPVALLSKDPGFPARLLSLISWGALAVTPLALWRLLAAAVAAYAPALKAKSKLDAALQLAGVTALTWTFYPLLKAYHLGQVQAWLNLDFALTIWCWIARREVAAGALLGFACLFKPQLGVLLLWGAARGRWRFAATAALCVAGAGAAALALYGWRNNFAYLGVLSYLGAHGETYYANQSVNGILNRWMTPGDSLAFHLHGFPPLSAPVRYGSALAAIVFLAASTFARYRRPGRGDPLDLAVAGLLCTMASPIAWEHHYGVAAIGFILALPSVIAGGSAARGALFAASFVFAANFLPAFNAFAGTALNLLQSYLFFAALGLAYVLITAPPWGAGAKTEAGAPAAAAP